MPVQQVLGITSLNGYTALLLTWSTGQTVRDYTVERPWYLWRLGVVFGETQARLHSEKVPPDSSIKKDWITWQTNDDTVLQHELQEIQARSNSLLHLDYHPQNVIVDESDVTGIIDWTNARIGDPRADFARTYTILKVEPWNPKRSRREAATRWLFEKAWRFGYEKIAGTLEDMPIFYAWAGTVMVNDLTHRVVQTDSWFEQSHLDSIRTWSNKWRKCAGLDEVW